VKNKHSAAVTAKISIVLFRRNRMNEVDARLQENVGRPICAVFASM
jgi:hypothetical protein